MQKSRIRWAREGGHQHQVFSCLCKTQDQNQSTYCYKATPGIERGC